MKKKLKIRGYLIIDKLDHVELKERIFLDRATFYEKKQEIKRDRLIRMDKEIALFSNKNEAKKEVKLLNALYWNVVDRENIGGF